MQVGVGGVAKLADYGALGWAGCGAEEAARLVETCGYSAPEVLRKVCVLPFYRLLPCTYRGVRAADLRARASA
jgi:hypothetical protein